MVAYWCRNALVLISPSRTPGITIDYPGQLDWRVLALSVAVCIGSTMLFALIPAIQASHVDLSGALKSEGSGVVGGSGRSRLRSVLVFVQVALSFVLIAGTGLLLRSLVQMQNSDPGFSTRNVVVSAADLFSAGYKPDRAKIFYEQLLERIRALPGVQSAALARVRPFSYAVYSSAPLEIEGYQPPRNEQVAADYNQVGEGYFATIGIPIVAGREFTRNDDENAPPVAIVNETMAAKYWPEKNAIGQRLKVKDKWMEIVGVAKNANYRTKLEQPNAVFLRAGSPELFRPKQLHHSDGPKRGRDHERARPRNPRARSKSRAAGRNQFAAASRSHELHATPGGSVAGNFRWNGALPRCNRALCSHVLLRFAKHARARAANGTRRSA